MILALLIYIFLVFCLLCYLFNQSRSISLGFIFVMFVGFYHSVGVLYYVLLEEKVWIYFPYLDSSAEDFFYAVSVSLLIIFSFMIGWFFSFKREKGGGKVDTYNLFKGMKSLELLLTSLSVVLFLVFFVFAGSGYIESSIGYDTEASVFRSLGHTSGILFMLVAGYAYSLKTSNKLYLILGFVVVVAYLSKGSRVGAIGPFLFYLGVYLADPNKRLGLCFSAILVPLLMVFPLYIREGYYFGLMNLVGTFFSFDFWAYNYFEYLFRVIGNFSSSFFIFSDSLILVNEKFGVGDLFVSFDPRSGFSSGWTQVFEEYRVNSFIPFSSLAEMAGVSLLLCAVYYFLLGGVVGFLDKNINRGVYIYYLVFPSVFMYMILMHQYNLRSVNRFLYLSFFILITIYLIRKVFRHGKA
ncbi:hypothetical protein ACMXYX_03360 [Neptuniibacter sp. QD72_48]|uniref:hypothetical protein n=1 Tax=Neptuniibacter sp. QD72_48 TaxID=3398214 RepID=UPI0039F5ED6F